MVLSELTGNSGNCLTSELTELTGNSCLWHEMACFLSCPWFHGHILRSVLIQAVVLHLFASLTWCYSICRWGCWFTCRSQWNYYWYLFAQLAGHMALTAEWRGDSMILRPWQVHTPTQTRANFSMLLVAIAAFTRNRATRHCFMILPDLLCASHTSCSLVTRSKAQALIVAAAKMFSPKQDALGYSYTFHQPNAKWHPHNCCWAL